MIFDEIPFELKEHIFTYVTPNEWINTAKVSNQWMDLTLRSIKKVESCHHLILDHLAEFINQQRDINYTWVSLLTLMPRLVDLECFEITQAFWTESSLICHQLKGLQCTPREVESFDWNKLHISFKNLVELHWDGIHRGPAFLFRIFELAPKLEKITVKRLTIHADWKNKIPKSVKHILLKDVLFADRLLYSMFLENAFTKCPYLETFCIDGYGINVTDSWRKSVPASVKSLKLWGMSVADNVRHYFSFDWLFQNYGALQSLGVDCVNWTGVDPQRFHSAKNLKKLYLSNLILFPSLVEDANPFSDICYHMILGSHLVDVELHKPVIDESWSHIFPPTVKSLKLGSFRLSNEAKNVFSPQFICENPSNLEFLFLNYIGGDLPTMDLNAFSGMNKLQKLYLMNFGVSGECLQSILTHCSALTNIFIRGLIAGALTNIPHNLVLPSLRTLDVEEPVDQPSLLLQHFPKIRKVDITIVPCKECWLEVMNCLQGVETAKISVKEPSFDLLWNFIENIDHTKFKYFCLVVKDAFNGEFTFNLTNSLLDACTAFHCFNSEACVLWMKNYPTLPLLRGRMSNISSSMDDLLQRYDNIMA